MGLEQLSLFTPSVVSFPVDALVVFAVFWGKGGIWGNFLTYTGGNNLSENISTNVALKEQPLRKVSQACPYFHAVVYFRSQQCTRLLIQRNRKPPPCGFCTSVRGFLLFSELPSSFQARARRSVSHTRITSPSLWDEISQFYLYILHFIGFFFLSALPGDASELYNPPSVGMLHCLNPAGRLYLINGELLRTGRGGDRRLNT